MSETSPILSASGYVTGLEGWERQDHALLSPQWILFSKEPCDIFAVSPWFLSHKQLTVIIICILC